MSNSKNAISEIKKLMVQFGFLSSEPTLLDFKLADDTILQAEALEVGKEIFKINELFEKVALENGAYATSEFNFEVENGKIKTIKELFIDAKLKNGTDISIKGPGIEPGAKIFVVKDGIPVPAPDDTHELADGTQVTTKDGEIVTVETPAEQQAPGEGSPAEEAAESPAEEGAEPVSPAEKDTAAADGAEKPMFPQHMEEMYNMMKDIVTKCGSMMQKMEGQYNALQSEFDAFKKQPAGNKISYSKTDFNKEVENALDARLKALKSLQNK